MIYFIYFLLILFIIIDIKFNKIKITPIKCFNFIWFITLFFYNMKFSYLQHDFLNRTLLIFLTAIISFDMFSLIFTNFIKIRFKSIKNNSSFLNKYSEDKVLFYLTNILIFLFIITCFYSKGFPLLWKIIKNGKTYLDFGITSLQGLMNGLAIFLGSISLFKKNNKIKYVILVYGLLIISRQVLMSLIVQGVVFKIFDIKPKETKQYIKKFALLFIICFFGFSIIGNFRSGNDVTTNMFTPRPAYTNLPKPIMWIYSYGTFSLSNFNKLVSMSDGFVNYGASTIEFMLPSVFTNSFKIKQNVNLYPKFLVHQGYNVSTYLVEMYMDLGFLGVIIFHLFIAFLGSVIFNMLKNNPCSRYKMYYAIFIHNIVFLFFVNMFLYPPIYIQFLYSYLFLKDGDLIEKK